LLTPSDIGIILSYRCLTRCKHCLYACGLQWKDWFDPDELREAVAAMHVWKHGFQVHLTGGEPFLNLPLLEEAVSIVAEGGIPQYVETNASWCSDEETAREQLTRLHDRGLRAILISCSPFQCETIPLARVLLCAEVSAELFGNDNVTLYLPHWAGVIARFGVEEPVPLQAYLDRYGEEKAGELFWEGYGLIGGGRSSYRLGHLTNRYPASAFSGDDCRRELLFPHHSHFDLYGNHISWFCGGLNVGRWRDLAQTIRDFEQGRYPQIIEMLVTGGASALFEFAGRNHDYEELPDGYTSKCHLCVDVRKHLSTRDEFPELQPQQFYTEL